MRVLMRVGDGKRDRVKIYICLDRIFKGTGGSVQLTKVQLNERRKCRIFKMGYSI